MFSNQSQVALWHDANLIHYSPPPPFHPACAFPEYPFQSSCFLSDHNPVYEAVRNLFKLMRLDASHQETPGWNPLQEWIKPGDIVVIKPNLVRHVHGLGLSLDSLITHPSVIRVVMDYVYIALQGHGTLIVGDAPLQTTDFDILVRNSGLGALADFYRHYAHLDFHLTDFRREHSVKDQRGRIVQRFDLAGDPRGYRAVNLGSSSLLKPCIDQYKNFRVTNYDPEEMMTHHNPMINEYLISQSVLDADVVINLPKLKTHRKGGITAALKNLVGINGSKDWLTHHTCGSVVDGGDEYLHPSLRKRWLTLLNERLDVCRNPFWREIYYLCKRTIAVTRHLIPYPDVYFEGSWYGNDTLWRMVLDLNRILLYADRQGTIQPTSQRKLIILVDALLAGEGEGPLEPTPKPCGLLVAGTHPVFVDDVCARVMGFDPSRIPLINQGLDVFGLRDKLQGLSLCSNDKNWSTINQLMQHHLGFVPSAGWAGQIERTV
ncbi:MAG: DUF362 domain-containing protein [Anaerolineae bacterium]|nr:DUF362 domain-containing protein [Anaerolineae bacterium]